MNIRGWVSHAAELTAIIRSMKNKPDLVCVNETFLNHSVEDIALEGYAVVGRRDRCDGRAGGGIAALAWTSIRDRVTLASTSEEAERMWLLVHAEQGPHLVGVWYRPPNPGEVNSVTSFQTELQGLSDLAIGSISIGDLNVHNRQWLRYSSHDSPEGRAMKDACDELGLEQLVRSPTREGHLLDLVVTDIAGVKVQTSPAISDHKLVTAELKFKTSESTTIDRTVWQYQKADWERMQQILTDADWSFLQGGNPHNGAKQFHDIITQAAAECIPTKT